MKFLEKYKYLLILLMIVILALFLRLYKLADESLWSDEIFQAILTSPKLSFSFVIKESARQKQPPLDYLMMHAAQLIRRSDSAVRLPAALFGVLSVAAIFLLARAFFDYKEAFISSFLLAICYFHIQYSQEARVYSLTALFSILSMWGFYLAVLKDKFRYWLLFLIIMLLAVYTHSFFQLAMLVQILAIIFLFLTRNIFLKESPDLITLKKLGKVILFLAVIYILYIPEVKLLLGKIAEYGQTSSVDNLTFTSRLKLTVENFSLLPFREAFFYFGVPLSWIYMVLAAIGLLATFRKKYSLQTALNIGFLIVLPLMIIFLMVYNGRYIKPRHLIFILPVYIVLISCGLVFISELFLQLLRLIKLKISLRNNFIANLVILLMVFYISIANINPLVSYYTTREKQDWRELTNFIDTYVPIEDELIFIPGWTVNNYYYYGKDRDWTIDSTNYYGYDKDYCRNLSSKFLRNKWWITSHGFEVDTLKDEESPMLAKEFIGGLKLWTIDGEFLTSYNEFLRIFPEQVKKIYKTLPDNSVIYINNLENFTKEYSHLEEELTKIIKHYYNKSNIEVKSVAKFDGLDSEKNILFLDFYKGELKDYTDQIISSYLKVMEGKKDDIIWSFSNSVRKGWEAFQRLSSGGFWNLKSTGSDPIIFSPPIDIPTTMVDTFEIRMRINSKKKKDTAVLFWITSEDAEWGSNKKWIDIDIISDNKFHTYTFDLLDHERFKKEKGDRLKQFRIDLGHQKADIEIEYIKLLVIKPDYIVKSVFFDKWMKDVLEDMAKREYISQTVPRQFLLWDFNNKKGWETFQNLASKELREGIWTLESTGTTPIMFSPPLDISTTLIHKFEVKMRVDANNKKGSATLFWITSNDPAWGSNTKWVNIDLLQDNNFHIYTIDLLNHERFIKDVKDKLTRLRFDPVHEKSHIQIDYIKLFFTQPIVVGKVGGIQ